MKEKPIIFTAESVNAIRDGRKTQTRRVIKVQPDENGLWPRGTSPGAYESDFPYQVGDRLWVKEAWGYHGVATTGADHRAFVSYLADKQRREVQFESFEEMWGAVPSQYFPMSPEYANADHDERMEIRSACVDRWWQRQKRKSPCVMPRWASRITLEVTAVRVERLQNISWEDAIAEGFRVDGSETGVLDKFRTKWNEINGKRAPWKSNSWVWVIEFEVLEVNK